MPKVTTQQLFDDLIGMDEYCRRDRETDRLGSHEIDDQFDLGGELDREVGRLFSFEDAADVIAGMAARFKTFGSVTGQAASIGKIA